VHAVGGLAFERSRCRYFLQSFAGQSPVAAMNGDIAETHNADQALFLILDRQAPYLPGFHQTDRFFDFLIFHGIRDIGRHNFRDLRFCRVSISIAEAVLANDHRRKREPTRNPNFSSSLPLLLRMRHHYLYVPRHELS
jgi:hypothetical protein